MSNSALQWLDAHGDVLYAFALRRLRDPHLAEDAVQNTLLAALEGVEQFAGQSSVQTWLIGILKFKIIDLLREQQHWQQVPDEAELDNSVGEDDLFTAAGHWAHTPVAWRDPSRELDNKQLRLLIDACLNRLPRRMAQLFWLRELNDEPAESVCSSLGISSANMYQLLFRARQTLRVCLSEGGRDGSLS